MVFPSLATTLMRACHMAAASPWVSVFLGVYGILWEMNSRGKTTH